MTYSHMISVTKGVTCTQLCGEPLASATSILAIDNSPTERIFTGWARIRGNPRSTRLRQAGATVYCLDLPKTYLLELRDTVRAQENLGCKECCLGQELGIYLMYFAIESTYRVCYQWSTEGQTI